MNAIRIIAVVLCALGLVSVGVTWTLSQDSWNVLLLERGIVETPPYRIDQFALGFGDGTIVWRRYHWIELAGRNGWSIPQKYWHRRWMLNTAYDPITARSARRPWYGFGIEPRSGRKTDGSWTQTMVWLPLWFPAILLAIYPTRIWICATRQSERLRNNQCLHCGYDLRESKDRCPECGRAIAHS